MSIDAKSKKVSRTPEAKEKRFLKLQAKRKRRKENRKLGETPQKTSDDGAKSQPEKPPPEKPPRDEGEDREAKPSGKGPVMKKKAKEPKPILSLESLSEDDKQRILRKKEKNRLRRKMIKEKLRTGLISTGGEIKDGIAVEGKAKRKKRRKRKSVEATLDEPSAKMAKNEEKGGGGEKGEVIAASSVDEGVVAGSGETRQLTKDESDAAKIEKKRQKMQLLKERTKLKKKARAEGRKNDAKDEVERQKNVKNVETVQRQDDGMEDVESGGDAKTVEADAAKFEKRRQKVKDMKEKRNSRKKENKDSQREDDGIGGSEVGGSMEIDAARIEKKIQKRKTLKDRAKSKKKMAKAQKDGERPVEGNERVERDEKSRSAIVTETKDCARSVSNVLSEGKEDEFAALVKGLERAKNPSSALTLTLTLTPAQPNQLSEESASLKVKPSTDLENPSTDVASQPSTETATPSSNTDAKTDDPSSNSANPPSKSADLKAKLESQLDGAKFRFINEKLYTMSSQDAVEMFKSDEGAFKLYHRGYGQQVSRWPVNPVDVIIDELKAIDSAKAIVDFGCGEAKLARELTAHGVHVVTSYDLVAVNEFVTACDMRRCPLPDESVDVVVFCLSLMGTNLVEFIREANRILKKNGILKIAEVESRCKDLKQFLRDLQKCGFKMTSKNVEHKVFFLIDVKKIGGCDVSDNFPLALEPCYYKKR